MTGFPEELVTQFRQVALERLDRVEQAWAAVMAKLDEESATIVHHELHTLKGESRMLGFSDVNLVCHKLEDMLEVARARGYAIDEDFDLAVNMAIRFMAMLVRKKVGSHLVGIDLPGFIKQIDAILAELRPEPPKTARTTTGMLPLKITAQTRVPGALRARLGPIAVDTFLEYSVSRGMRRDRMRTSWHGLRDMIGIHRAVLGPGQLSKHKSGGQSLARELGKQVDFVFELEAVEATAEILMAVDTAVLHLVRNAVDHGVDTTGTIKVRAAQDGDHWMMSVEDDGRGIDLESVRKRAIDRGHIDPKETDIRETWLDIVCQPGFTTRSEASDVSGRGVGLDAVRTGIQEIGGTLTATTSSKGTSWHVRVPLPRISIPVVLFRVPHLPFPIAIDNSWQPVDGFHLDAPLFDIAHLLGISDEGSTGTPRFFRRAETTIGLVTDRTPLPAEVRRLVAAPPPAIGEIMVSEATEGLLLRPERLR